MVRNSFLALILITVLAVTAVAATNNSYTDAQIFAQAEAMGLKLGMPTDSTDAAPAIDPGGQIIRTTECWWLYGRPKTDSQLAEVVCEFQITVKGGYYTDFYQWYWVLASQNAPQLPKLLEQIEASPYLADFRQIVLEEIGGVRSMTFIASRERGVIFPTPEQFKP